MSFDVLSGRSLLQQEEVAPWTSGTLADSIWCLVLMVTERGDFHAATLGEDGRSRCDHLVTLGLSYCVCMVLSVFACCHLCGCHRLPGCQARKNGYDNDVDEPLSERMMLRISRHFTDVDSCLRFANRLDLNDGSNFVESLNPSVTPISEIAFRVLKQWDREKGNEASSRTLHRVLVEDMSWPVVAAQLTKTADICRSTESPDELSVSDSNCKWIPLNDYRLYYSRSQFSDCPFSVSAGIKSFVLLETGTLTGVCFSVC